MDEDEFKNKYLNEWKPDPLISEIVYLLRYASKEEISDYRKVCGITQGQINEARRILDMEREG